MNLKNKIQFKQHTGTGMRGKLRDCSLVLDCVLARSGSNRFGPRCLICLGRKIKLINLSFWNQVYPRHTEE